MFGNGGFNNGLGGWGGGIVGFILGLLFGNGGFGNGFGGFGGGAAASLGAQATANNNTDLIMNAINGTDSDVRLLATTLNSDVNAVKDALATINTGLATVGSQVGMSSLQVVNAIQSGNAALASQLCQCCGENKLLITEQGFQSQLATLNQTQAITDAIADFRTEVTKEFCDVKEREYQSKIDTQNEIITQLRGKADNAEQTNQILGYINSVVTPLQKEISEIKAAQPNTVPVQWPNLTAINTTPYAGPYYGMGSIWA